MEQSVVNDKKSLVRKVLNSITVEPFVLAWVLPSCLLIVAMENLNLEKACRVNLRLGNEVCENMINKTMLYNVGKMKASMESMIPRTEYILPSSSLGTHLETIDLIATDFVATKISTVVPA